MTVEIICPHCNFSTRISREKIPEKARWARCPKCKERFELTISHDSAAGMPAAATDGVPGASPWEMRSDLGLWQGLYQTFTSILFSPERLFGSMTSGGGLREPLAFGILFGSIGTMFGLFWQFLMMKNQLLSSFGSIFGEFALMITFIGVVILSPLFVTVLLITVSAVLHLCLLTVGGGKNGFEGTFRVVAYSQATQIFTVVPFVGGLVGWFWCLIVQVIGLREIHETTYLKVIIAFCIPLMIMLLFTGVVLIVLFVI